MHELVFEETGPAHVQLWRTPVTTSHGTYRHHYVTLQQGTHGAVCVITNNNHVLIGLHYRPTIDKTLLEFPRGMGETGETPIQTAVRECTEETGLNPNPRHGRNLGLLYADSGILANRIYAVILPVETQELGKRDLEFTQLRWVSFTQWERLITTGQVSDGITLAAWALARTTYLASAHNPSNL